MAGTNTVVRSHEDYFRTVRDFNRAPKWQQELMLRSSLLKKCIELEPVSIRLRFQRFWDQQARRLNVSVKELKTWN